MNPFHLPRSTEPQPAHLFRDCVRCKTLRPPEGGVEMGPTKWVCFKCWGREVQRRAKA